MGRHTRIRRRPSTGVYQFRIPIPLDLQGHGPYVTRTGKPKTEIAYSLQTRDYREAVAREPLASLKAEQEFARLRRLRDGPVKAELSPTEIDRLAAIYFHQLLEEDEEGRVDGDTGEVEWREAQGLYGITDREFENRDFTIAIVGDHLRQALARGNASVVADEVDELLSAQGVTLDRSSESYRRLSHAILRVSVQANEAARKRHAGELIETPPAPPPFYREVAVAPSQGGAPATPEVTLEAVLKGWQADQSPEPQTFDQFKTTVEIFAAHIAPRHLGQATKDDVVSWKTGMQEAGRKPSTIATYMTRVKTVLTHAVGEGLILSNPFDGVRKPTAKQRRGTGRRGFNDAETVTLLTAARSRKGYLRWVPWLMAFTGARVGEVSQPLVSDLQSEDGVHFLMVTEDQGDGGDNSTKRLKTEASYRRLPIHPRLIQEGFLEYAASLPAGGALFPDLAPDKYGSRGGTSSDTLKHWVRGAMKITDPRIAPNHSWRHRMKDLLRNSGAPPDVQDAILGHEAGRNAGDGYGLGFNVKVLHEHLSRIAVPDGL